MSSRLGYKALTHEMLNLGQPQRRVPSLGGVQTQVGSGKLGGTINPTPCADRATRAGLDCLECRVKRGPPISGNDCYRAVFLFAEKADSQSKGVRSVDAKEILQSGITISDWLMMLAVVLGPILAVQIQKLIDRNKEGRDRRLKVFRDLMTTRASTLAFQHVSALNMVGLEFNGKKYGKVVNAWKTYIDHLGSFPDGDENLQKIWSEKKNDQLSDLLYEMGESLGFSFDKVHIKKAGYFPQAYADQERELNFIRKKLVDVFLNKDAIPMSVVYFPADDEALETQKNLHRSMQECFEGKRSIPVSIEKNSGA